MRTKKHIQAAKYFAFLGDVQRYALKGFSFEQIPISQLQRQHHIGGWRQDLIADWDLTLPTSMERACALMTLAYEYGKDMKATRDERGAHRTHAEEPEQPATMPEMEAMKDEVDRFFDKLPEMVPVQDDATLPLMSDREMIAALTRHGYIVCKPVNTAKP